MQIRFALLLALFAAGCPPAGCGSGSSGRTRAQATPGKTNTVTPPSPKPPEQVTSPTGPTSPTKPAARRFERMIVIVLENTDAASALAQPYLKDLASRGAYLADYNALTHPSYPNYLAMVAGTTFGITDDAQRTFDAPSVGDLLVAKGFDWKTYAQAYPGNCFLGDNSGTYWRKHVPFLSLLPVQKDPAKCGRVVDAPRWNADVSAGALPAFALYVPDINNDGHNTSVAYASTWLQGFLEPLLVDPVAMKGTLVVVTFDEAATYNAPNRIYTAFVGPMVRTGAVSHLRYDHYSLLRTLEDNFKLGTLGKSDQYAKPITDVWR